jgi:hypothetical protein
MSHPLVRKRKAWCLVSPQAGHARATAADGFAAGTSTSGDDVCKELAFISSAACAVGCFARLETRIVLQRAARHGAVAPMYVT